MLWYLMAVHRGVKGIVAGNYTTKSEPIAATLRFDGIDKDIFSDSVTGEYYKILKPGTYAVTASAAGYATKYITDIVVKDSLATVLNIELDGVGIEDDTAQLPNGIILEQNYPNPFNPSTNISFSLDRQLELNIYIYDRKGNTVKEFARREFKAGRHTIEFNAEGLSSGVYYCCLKDVEGGEISKKMLMLK